MHFYSNVFKLFSVEVEVNFADTNEAKMHIKQLLLGWEIKQTGLQSVVQYFTHGFVVIYPNKDDHAVYHMNPIYIFI